MSSYVPLQKSSPSMFCPQHFSKPYSNYLLVHLSTFGSTHIPNFTPPWTSPCVCSTKGGQEMRDHAPARNSEPPQSPSAAVQLNLCLWESSRCQARSHSWWSTKCVGCIVSGLFECLPKCYSFQHPALGGTWQRDREGSCNLLVFLAARSGVEISETAKPSPA